MRRALSLGMALALTLALVAPASSPLMIVLIPPERKQTATIDLDVTSIPGKQAPGHVCYDCLRRLPRSTTGIQSTVDQGCTTCVENATRRTSRMMSQATCGMPDRREPLMATRMGQRR